MSRILVVIVAALGINACAVVPEQIQIADDTILVPFEQVISNPQAVSAIGEKARWGGRIVSVQNKEKVSEIEVFFFPSSGNGKPKTGDESQGRFKALVPGFVDPLVFEKDRLITIVGEVATSEDGIIGEQVYTYPTLNAVGYYMWKQSSDIEVQHIGYQPFFYGAPFYGSAWNNWYSPWRPGFYRSRVRVIKNNGHSQGSQVSRPSQQAVRNNSATRSSPSQPALKQR